MVLNTINQGFNIVDFKEQVFDHIS
jgi:hypothetical protein